MSQDFSDARSFGLVDVPRDRDLCFRVWKTPYLFENIQTSLQPIDAYWSGDVIIVEFLDGTKRRYFDFSQFTQIW